MCYKRFYIQPFVFISFSGFVTVYSFVTVGGTPSGHGFPSTYIYIVYIFYNFWLHTISMGVVVTNE